MSKVHLGHRARKRFGQNFLHDEHIIDQIVSAIDPRPEQQLVEVGPGLGALTEPVAELVDHLTCIELDRDLALRLRQHPFLQEKLTIVEADVLTIELSTLLSNDKNKNGDKIRVFGNLPYNISTPLIFHLFEQVSVIEDMHFMLQYEVVKRLCAGVGESLYGRLSIMCAYYCQAIPVLMVPPHAFKPAPKVDSAIIRLIPHQTPPVNVKNIKTLEKIVAAAFNQRRKTVKNSLSNMLTSEQLSRSGIDPNVRAQDLSLFDFATLANLYEQTTQH